MSLILRPFLILLPKKPGLVQRLFPRKPPPFTPTHLVYSPFWPTVSKKPILATKPGRDESLLYLNVALPSATPQGRQWGTRGRGSTESSECVQAVPPISCGTLDS